MSILPKRQSLSKPKTQNIRGASDQNVTRTFIWNRAWLANQWILLITPLLVVGLGIMAYAAFALPATCGVPAHQDGAIIRNASAGDPAVYLMKDGVRRGFPTVEVMSSYGYNYGMVKQSTCGDQATRIDPPLGFKQGTIVKGSGGGIYAIGGPDFYSASSAVVKYPFPNWEAYAALGYSLADATVIPDSQLNAIPLSSGYMDGNWHPSGSLVYIGGTTYMVYNGQLLGIPTQQILSSWHIPLGAKPATAVESAAYAKTAILAFNEGTLLQGSTNSIYALDQTGGNLTNGGWTQKRGFTSQQVLNDLGYVFADAIHVADSALPAVTGAPITEPDNPPYGVIDTPAAGITVSGTINVGGWAIDGANVAETSIAHVDISIDNRPPLYGAIYGANRPDVCGSYPNRPGCPLVGWNWSFNTALVADGTHTIYVTIYDNDPTQHSTTLTRTVVVNNSSNSPIGYIEVPATTGTIDISGWALDSAAAPSTLINQVSLTIDSRPQIYGAILKQSRPDVCANASYAGRPGCPDVGWKYSGLDTTQLGNGTHTINATIYDSDPTRHSTVISRTFTVNNPSGQPPPTGPSSNGTNGNPSVFIDSPASNSTISSGYARISGWAIDNTYTVDHSIDTLKISIDNGIAKTGIVKGDLRKDVCDAYDMRAGCPYVGWHYDWDTTGYADGLHKIAITATDTDSTPHSSTYNLQVTTKKPASVPPVLTLESPANNNPPLVGTVKVSGWALSASARITSVSAIINGKTYALGYGTDRSSVCVSRGSTSPDCPKVGFSYDLDTTQIKNGPAQLTVVVTAGNSTSTSTSIPVTINNPVIVTSTRNTVDRPDDISGYQVHVMYVVPNDFNDNGTGPDNNGSIERSINTSQKWLSTQTGGHNFRMDTYGGKLDISYVKTNQPTSYYNQLVASNPYGYSNVDSSVRLYLMNSTQFNQTNKIYLIYLEASAGNTPVCGISDYRQVVNYGVNIGKIDYFQPYYAVNFSYAPNNAHGSCQNTPLSTNPDIFGDKESVWVHETFHAIGLSPSCSPHTSNTGIGHVAGSNVGQDLDDPNLLPNASAYDILSPISISPRIVDFNKDDYLFVGNTPTINNLRTNCLPNLNTTPFMTGTPF